MVMRSSTSRAIVFVFAVLLVGCAARRPVLYSNEHLNRVGYEAAESDIEECKRLAESRGAPGQRGETARQAAESGATGAAIGAAGGAAGGAVYGGAGRGAAAGAAGGAAAGLLSAVFRGGGQSATYKNYVNACLADRGYQVVGWE